MSLRSQSEVNAFAPCVAVIHGNLNIEGEDIYDLDPLNNLQGVTGNISIKANLGYEIAWLEDLQIFGKINVEPFEITNETIDSSIRAYPNPASNNLNIQLHDQFLNAEIQIHDAYGKLIWSQNIESVERFTIETEKWNRGVYWLSVKTETGSETLKLMIL